MTLAVVFCFGVVVGFTGAVVWAGWTLHNEAQP